MAIDLRAAKAREGGGAGATDERAEHEAGIAEHHRTPEVAMVEHERIGRGGFVAPQTDLGGELHLAPRLARLRNREPRRQVRDTRAGEHRVGAEHLHAIGQVARAPHRGVLPAVGRCIEIGWELGFVGAPRLRIGLGSQRCDAVVTETAEVLVLRVDLEHPVPDPVVEVVAARGARASTQKS